MNKDFNLYDPEKLNEAIKALKSFPVTTGTKIEHTAKVFELENLLDRIAINTGSTMIKLEYNSYFGRYYETTLKDFKTTKKERLDDLLKLAIKHGIQELIECYQVEQNTKNGVLVPDPKYHGSWIEPEILAQRPSYNR